MKKIITLIVVVVLAGVGYWYVSTLPAGEQVKTEERGETPLPEETFVLKNATGTVAFVSQEKLELRTNDGVLTLALNSGSQFIKLVPNPAAAAGSPVVVVYSKKMNKPTDIILSKPFPYEDPSKDLEIIAGSLVSQKDNVIEVNVSGETKKFVFDRKNPLNVPTFVGPNVVEMGKGMSVEYKETSSGLFLTTAALW